MSVEDDNNLPDRAEIETEARKLGWVPEEEFRGNKDHWIDADEFVERGQTLMPILRQNNRRLQGELLTRDREIDNLKSKLDNMEKVQDKLEKHYTAANKRAVELAKIQLREELKKAREDNDVDAEMDILDKLDDVRKRENEVSDESKKDKKPDTKTTDKDGYTPEFRQWLKENPWFDGTTKEDKKKTKLVTRIAEDLREEGSDLQGVEFFEECVRVYEKQYGDPNEDEEEEDDKPRRRANKVDVPSSRSRRGGGKGYADLPSDAKQACDEDIEEFVGPDKKYKTAKEWRDQYAKIYFAE